MFPIKGLVDPPVIGGLETSFKEIDLDGRFLGGAQMGSTVNPQLYMGMRTTTWGYSYTNGDVVIHDGAREHKLFDRTGITELNICFDSYMLPVVTYVYNGEAFYRYFDITTQHYVTRNLTEQSNKPVRTPRVCYDDRRRQFRSSASVILSYFVENQLMIRTSDDRFRSPQIIKEYLDNNTHLNQVCMGTNNRLHFITYRNKE